VSVTRVRVRGQRGWAPPKAYPDVLFYLASSTTTSDSPTKYDAHLNRTKTASHRCYTSSSSRPRARRRPPAPRARRPQSLPLLPPHMFLQAAAPLMYVGPSAFCCESCRCPALISSRQSPPCTRCGDGRLEEALAARGDRPCLAAKGWLRGSCVPPPMAREAPTFVAPPAAAVRSNCGGRW
jgi:hypothetical protein